MEELLLLDDDDFADVCLLDNFIMGFDAVLETTLTGSSFAARCLRDLLPGSAPIFLQ